MSIVTLTPMEFDVSLYSVERIFAYYRKWSLSTGVATAEALLDVRNIQLGASAAVEIVPGIQYAQKRIDRPDDPVIFTYTSARTTDGLSKFHETLSNGTKFFCRPCVGLKLTAGSFARVQGILYWSHWTKGFGLGAEEIHFNPTNNTTDVSIFRLNLGSTDDATPTPKENAEQFLRLLDTLADLDPPPTIILCHCGVGPSLPDDSDELADYKDNFDKILAYENVYFDLAGMQVGISPKDDSHKAPVQQLIHDNGEITQLGQYLLDKIRDHNLRFMLGTDVDNGYDDDFLDEAGDRFGVNTFEASWANYEDFLSRDPSSGLKLNDVEKEEVRHQNALRLVDV